MKKELDTHIMVWLWPVTILISVPIVVIGLLAYGWLWLGNIIIDYTIGDNSPLN